MTHEEALSNESQKNDPRVRSISKDIYDRKIHRARQVLLEKGIIALDGSGEPDVESLFTMLRWFENEQLIIRDMDEISKKQIHRKVMKDIGYPRRDR